MTSLCATHFGANWQAPGTRQYWSVPHGGEHVVPPLDELVEPEDVDPPDEDVEPDEPEDVAPPDDADELVDVDGSDEPQPAVAPVAEKPMRTTRTRLTGDVIRTG